MKNLFKTIVLALLLACTPLAALCQTQAVEKIAQLDEVYTFYVPYSIVSQLGNWGGTNILKATPIPSGLLKNVKTVRFVMASKKKVVKKAEKILKDLDKDRNYTILLRSSKNNEESVTIYAFPAGAQVFNEVILVVNEANRQLIVLQCEGEISQEDINDLQDELN